ncbi:Aldo/keto reductase [Ramaria rubella]|nr:Aldo/keto reductase [Ramaria rubella]
MPFASTPLNDGNKLPQIAFGTGSALYGRDATDSVEQALDSGFWHIDTAASEIYVDVRASAAYGNEASVGVAIRESGLKREELYITTKYDGGDIREEIEKSLKKLGTSYVDLYLIHFPQFVEGRFESAWVEFEKIKADGLAKSIGVSNFNVQDLQLLLKTAKIVPAVNQVNFNPYNYNENLPLLEYSAKHGIVTEAYSSLTPITKTPGGPVDKPVEQAAKRLGATPAQVILSWVKSKGVVIVTTSSKKDRLKEYLEVADLPPLTAQEIAEIDAAGAKGPSSLSIRPLAPFAISLAVLTLLYFTTHWSVVF